MLTAWAGVLLPFDLNCGQPNRLPDSANVSFCLLNHLFEQLNHLGVVGEFDSSSSSTDTIAHVENKLFVHFSFATARR